MAEQTSHTLNDTELQQWYKERGFGGRVGFGERPALLVIDMAKAWLDTTSPLGSERVQAIAPKIVELLEVARKAKIPIFFTTMEFDENMTEAGNVSLRKLSHWDILVRGSEWTTLDPRWQRQPNEILIKKQRASAFFDTSLLANLIGNRVDTLIITGCSTSGCVRGTAESSFNYNLNTIVVRDAVADRSPSAHEANLFDIDNRYADVVPSDEVKAYLESLIP